MAQQETMAAAQVLLIGLNHTTAPVEVRERLAFGPVLRERALAQLRCLGAGGNGAGATLALGETALLSTCNRTEVYASARDGAAAERVLRGFLLEQPGVVADEVSPHLYVHRDEAAVRHVFAVAAGIDSMIVGEPQILGQVRETYESGVAAGTVGVVLSALFRQAIEVGKRARTETEIARNAVSVSYAAVELARKVFGGLRGRRVLLVGAGKMSVLSARALAESGVAGVWVVNRTIARATEVAVACGGEAREWGALEDLLREADVVISSTGAPRAVLRYELLHGVMKTRRGRDLLLIDIAVPRDVEPEVRRLSNVFLFDVDDLQAVIEANLRERRKEIRQVEAIIEEEAPRFTAWMRGLAAVPTIAALRERLEQIRQEEFLRLGGRLRGLTAEQQNVVQALTVGIVNKILHEPTMGLKRTADHQQGYLYAAAIRELFGLLGAPGGNGEEPGG